MFLPDLPCLLICRVCVNCQVYAEKEGWEKEKERIESRLKGRHDVNEVCSIERAEDAARDGSPQQQYLSAKADLCSKHQDSIESLQTFVVSEVGVAHCFSPSLQLLLTLL